MPRKLRGPIEPGIYHVTRLSAGPIAMFPRRHRPHRLLQSPRPRRREVRLGLPRVLSDDDALPPPAERRAGRSAARNARAQRARVAPRLRPVSGRRLHGGMPTGSGRMLTPAEVADELGARLTAIFLERDDGTRTVFGGYELFQRDPAWHGLRP